MRRIAVVTVGRSDYGILRPLLKRLHRSGRCALQLVVGGMHFDARQGSTCQEILADEIPVTAKVVVTEKSDDAIGVSAAFAEGVVGMAEAYDRLKPDLIVVLGDRFEMFAAATAAVFACKPLAHLHGGELTLGAIDDVIRHSITKMSHLHFVSTVRHAERVIQMGEEPWRVHVSGALALDNLDEIELLPVADLKKHLGFSFQGKPVVATFHPPTLGGPDLEAVAEAFLGALRSTGRTVVITAPNTDPGGRLLHEKFAAEARSNPKFHFVESLGTKVYFSLMNCAAAMVGNSSSGIIEAASFRLPVVNIGSRQEGRFQPENVINCGNSRPEIESAIDRALSETFRDSLANLSNPYGSGRAAEFIAGVLLDIALDERLLGKQFHDLECGERISEVRRE